MYKLFIKPILFLLNAENAHKFAIYALKCIGKLPFCRSIMRSAYRVDDPSLEREVLGLRFRNPIGIAAGFDVNGDIVNELEAIGFGFVEVGSITPEPQGGNPKPRLFRIDGDKAIVQRMGHPNKGWANAIHHLRNRKNNIIVGCNIARNNNTSNSGASKEFQKCFRNLYQYVDYFTVNINFKYLEIGEDSNAEEALTELLTPLFDFRRGQSDYRPILVKLSPDLDDAMIDAVSDVLIATPLDGVVATSGSSEHTGLTCSEYQLEKMGRGRLCGAPIRERALRVVRRVHERTDGAYPIIGVGGLMSADDIKAMMEAGASLVQIYSGFIYGGPSIVGDMCRELIIEIEKEHSVDLQGGEFSESN
ncbi:MAG: quinone-dependent dihydroorotate dehydrogenase [Rikenellaceae bacterium]